MAIGAECLLRDRQLLGRVDAIVNCAGILNTRSLKTPSRQSDPVLNVNLNGAFYVTKAAFKTMATKGFDSPHRSRLALR